MDAYDKAVTIPAAASRAPNHLWILRVEASELLLGLWRQPKLLPAQADLPLQRVEGGLALLGGQLRHLLDPSGLLLARQVRVGRQLEAVRGVLVRVRARG